MSEPGKPVFKPLDVAQAAANLAATAYPGTYVAGATKTPDIPESTAPSADWNPAAVVDDNMQSDIIPAAAPVTSGAALASRPPSPEITLRAATLLRGISRVGTQDQLPRLPLPRATVFSAVAHVVIPVVLFLAFLGWLLGFAFLMHLNFWDFFQPKRPQDMTFTLVENTHAPRPEHALFKGVHNQQAGGQQNHHQAINPVQDAVAAHPKPAQPQPPATQQMAKPQTAQPQPKPAVQPTPHSEPVPKAVVPPPSPQPAQPKADQPLPAQMPPAIAKPAKAQQKPEPERLKLPVPPPKSSQVKPQNQAAIAPEPLQVSSRSADFGISTTPPSGAVAPNPQDGKARNAGVDVAEDADVGPFMADLKKRINRNWIPPRGMESRKVVLVFFVRHDGQLADVQVQKSSGDAEADRRAIEAIQTSAPFMALPPQIKEDILPVEFTFDYNVLNPQNAKHAMKW